MTSLPRYVHVYKDRHDHQRVYFRHGLLRIVLPQPVGSPEFWAAYAAAIQKDAAERPPDEPSSSPRRLVVAGTIDWALLNYLNSSDFNSHLKPRTQYHHRNVLTRWADAFGDRPVRYIRPTDIDGWLAGKAHQWGAAMNFAMIMNRFLDYCIAPLQLITENPMDKVKRPKTQREGDGFHSWTDNEIALWRHHYPTGSKARLAFELAYGLHLRREDIPPLGWPHLRNNGKSIFVTHQKTGWHGELKMPRELLVELKAASKSNLTFLVTEYGKPFTVAGFGNKFGDWCRAVPGLPKVCSIHGLRKAGLAVMAEAGVSEEEIMSRSGHASSRSVKIYTKAAKQKVMQGSALAKVEAVANRLKLATR